MEETECITRLENKIYQAFIDAKKEEYIFCNIKKRLIGCDTFYESIRSNTFEGL